MSPFHKFTLPAAAVLLFLLLPVLGAAGPDAYDALIAEPQPEAALDEGPTRAGVPNMDANISYAIITDFRFAPYLEELKQMKTTKGVKAEIYTLNESTGILYNYNARGIDDAQRIHEFLRDLEKLNPDLEWVLLVGDHEIIPSRRLYLNGTVSTNYKETDDSGFQQYTYSDYYYAGLDSTWNSDPDQKPVIWGEEGETDWTPNVYVGRLPVSNIIEVKRAVQNIIDYETNPPPGYWYRSALTIAALMDTPNILSYPPNQNLAYQSYKDNAYEVALKIDEHIPDQMTNYMLYDYNSIPGGSYSPFYDTLNRSNAQHYYNLGNSVVTIASHGYENGDALLHYQSDGDIFYGPQTTFSFFDYQDAYNVKNGGMLPLVYGSACGVGNFTEGDDTNMERLLYAPKGGAIGVIMASSESTYRCEFQENDSSYGNWWLINEFWRLFFEKGYYRPGKALYETKVNYGDRIIDPYNPHKEYPYKTLYKTNRVAYNLLGDPEIPIWTDVPQEMDIEYPDPYHINNKSLTIKVATPGGLPIEGASVCIYSEGIYITGETLSNGSFTIEMDLDRTMVLNITVTAHNYLRWSRSVEVVSVADLACERSSFGRSVEHPAAGEVISVFINVTNKGEVPVTGVRVDLYESSVEAKNLLRSFTQQSFNPQESRRFITTWKTGQGTNSIIVFIDPLNKVFENNEDNNLEEFGITANKPVKWLQNPWVNMTEDTQLLDHKDRLINLYEFGIDEDQGPLPLSFSIENVSEPNCNCSLVERSDSEVLLNVVPPKDWTGTVKVIIGMTDGPTKDTTEVTILVEEVPDGPHFPDIPHIYANESTWITVGITAHDIDSAELNFTCSSETLNITCDQFGNKSVNLSFLANNSMVGGHTVVLRAQDEHGMFEQINIPVTVLNVNTPPFIISEQDKQSIQLKVGEEFIDYIYAGDSDKGDVLRFSDDSPLFDINGTTGAIQFTPGSGEIGEHRVKITVTDENGTRDSIDLTFEITEDTFEGNSYTVMIIFAVCVIIIVAVSLLLQSKRTEAKRESDQVQEGPEKELEPISIREWSSRDSDIDELVNEYSGDDGGTKRLKLKKVARIKPANRPALPPAEARPRKRPRSRKRTRLRKTR